MDLHGEHLPRPLVVQTQPTPEKLGGSSWQGGKVGREIRCLTKLEECDLDWRFDGCILICVCARARASGID